MIDYNNRKKQPLIDLSKDEIKALSHQFMQQLGSNEQGKTMTK